MESSVIKRNIRRDRRVKRVRKKLRGTSERPRLSIVKTNKHIFAQLIDDEAGKTILSSSTLSLKSKKSKESAAAIGTKIAELSLAKKIDKIIFDRGRYKYHGLLAELANAAREAGLQF